MESIRYPFIIYSFLIYVLSMSLFLRADVKKLFSNSEQFESGEKLKISYLCFRKDNLPTHLFDYLNEQENETNNLLFVKDIMDDEDGSLKYFLSFATHEEIWGDEDKSRVKSKIKLDPYFRKNSDRFLREKAFFEIKQRMEIADNESQKKQRFSKPVQDIPHNQSVQTVMEIESPKPLNVSQPEEETEESTKLATYLLIAGAVCLAGGLLKKAL